MRVFSFRPGVSWVFKVARRNAYKWLELPRRKDVTFRISRDICMLMCSIGFARSGGLLGLVGGTVYSAILWRDLF
jgi:hypothetical protein